MRELLDTARLDEGERRFASVVRALHHAHASKSDLVVRMVPVSRQESFTKTGKLDHHLGAILEEAILQGKEGVVIGLYEALKRSDRETARHNFGPDLGRLQSQAGRAFLRKLATTDDTLDNMAVAIAYGVKAREDEKAVLRHYLLGHPCAGVRLYAARSLGFVGGADCVPALIATLRDDEEWMMDCAMEGEDATPGGYAAEALMAMTGQNLGRDVGAWRKWWMSSGMSGCQVLPRSKRKQMIPLKEGFERGIEPKRDDRWWYE